MARPNARPVGPKDHQTFGEEEKVIAWVPDIEEKYVRHEFCP